MFRISLFIVNIVSFIILISFAQQLFAMSNNDFIDIKIFSKEKTLQNITINSNTELLSLKKTLFLKEKWNIKSDKKFLILYNHKTKHHLPDKITLNSLNNSPICIGINSQSRYYNRCYTGNIKIVLINNQLQLINNLPVIDYLYSTVGSELPQGWPEEAVKTQAIIIHTYLNYALKNHIILEDTTQNQFYGGVNYINKSYKIYIDEVKNIIITDKNNLPIEALYHSTCAGETLNNENVFGGKPRYYLRSVKCYHDSDSNFYSTKVSNIYKELLKKIFHTSRLKFIKDKDNRLNLIVTDNKTYTPYQFWIIVGKELGWGKIPGVKFKVDCLKDKCKITSKGAGHAVGLCQWGARGLALKGFTYRQILQYYYKGISFFTN